MLAQAGSSLYTLTGGQPVPIQAGQTLKVFYSFSYKVSETTSVPIWASLYRYSLGVLNRVEQAQTKTTITLDAATVWQTCEGQIDIAVGNVSAGVYGLILELPGFKDAGAKIDDCIEVIAAAGIMEMLPMLMMVMVMGMVMETVE